MSLDALDGLDVAFDWKLLERKRHGESESLKC